MLPYEHHENMESQKKCKYLANLMKEQLELRSDASEGIKKYANSMITFAEKHMKNIE